ncbi:MAG: hypothetical protein P8Y63_11060 [Deltaproteobacteria bacterium]|jgi:hypothetical protein
MVEIEAGLPLSLDDVMTIAAGKRARLSVELATRPVIDRAPAEIGGSEAEAYLLTAHFHFNIDGEPYRVSKPYVEGFQDEPGETAVAHRKIANERLRRDYRRLQEAGFEIESRYFETLVAAT